MKPRIFTKNILTSYYYWGHSAAPRGLERVRKRKETREQSSKGTDG